MASVLQNLYNINGVISTDKTVFQNLETMCTAINAWLTFDTTSGKWAFVLNEAGTSTYSFDDSNIIGGISINSTGLNELYNSVRVEFPHIDLDDQVDYVQIDIPDVDRNPNEPDNTLVIQLDCINNPVQAEVIALRNLKQCRVDKVIKFVTDFNAIGTKAGDLIDVTNSIYGFTNKIFRVVSLTETDDDDGNILLEITALEYDSAVYDTDITRYVRSSPTGITSIGAIGIPGTPIVNKFEITSRPRIQVGSTVPTGIVEAMEFWYTSDVPPGVTLEENRTYSLLTTAYPTVGNVFNFGDTVTAEFDQLNAGNFLIKSRGVNSSTSGPFSIPSGVVYYAPIQATDAITNQTQVVDSNTGGLLTALAAATLLNKVDGLFGNVSNSGSLFDKVFKLYKNVTGTDIVQAGKAGTPSSILIAGTNIYTGLADGSSNYVFETIPIAPIVGGTYQFSILFDTNTSGCNGGRGADWTEVEDLTRYRARVLNGATVVKSGTSGGVGAFYWSDFLITFTATLAAGIVYDLEFDLTYDAGSIPGADLGVTVGYTVTRIG